MRITLTIRNIIIITLLGIFIISCKKESNNSPLIEGNYNSSGSFTMIINSSSITMPIKYFDYGPFYNGYNLSLLSSTDTLNSLELAILSVNPISAGTYNDELTFCVFISNGVHYTQTTYKNNNNFTSSVSITINETSSSSISGTFSGVICPTDTLLTDKNITISNGSFICKY